MDDIFFIATCPDETKEILAQELKDLGAWDIELDYACVYARASREIFYRAHLELRTASQILQVIAEVPSPHVNVLQKKARRIEWQNVFSPTKTFAIEGVPADRGPEFMNANTISRTVREGLIEVFQKAGKGVPKVDIKNPDVPIIAYVRGKKATISVCTSGKALHKRGYRHSRHPAPMKETLASAILLMLGYDGKEAFYDPMCGSGTAIIEAAMIALKKAPLIHRKKEEFSLEHLLDFDRALWRRVQDEARERKSAEAPGDLFASDINDRYIDETHENALRARVERYLRLKSQDFLSSKAPARSGLLFANMPYGERFLPGSQTDFTAFYKNVGDVLKRNYTGWRAALLVAEDSPYKMIGLKPKRKIKLHNGSIPVRLLVFDLYKGSTADHKRL